MENDDVRRIASLGAFSVLEYQKDLSVSPENAMNAYFCAEMNIRKRQIVCDISKSNVTVIDFVSASAIASTNNLNCILRCVINPNQLTPVCICVKKTCIFI